MPDSSAKNKGSLWQLLTSVKLTIFLLISLAVASIIGTIIPQNQPSSTYIGLYGEAAYNLLKRLQFFDLYHSVWFVLLLGILTLNLVICSIKRFSSTWYVVKRRDIKPTDFLFKSLSQRGNMVTSKPLEEVKEICQRLLVTRFKKPTTTENEGIWYLYADKGRYTRLGVYVVHLSVILILVGGVIGLFLGFRAHVNIVEGGTADKIFLRGTREGKDLGFVIRCEDFNITYYDTGQPKEYKSILTILDGGKEVLKKTIRVNHPLSYKGLSFYQSSFGIARINQVKLHIRPATGDEGYTMDVPLRRWIKAPGGDSFFQVIDFYENLMNFGPAVKIGYRKPGDSPVQFWIFKNDPYFDVGRKGEYIFSLLNYEGKYYTGLQVTKDPGVWVVWTGCTLMVLGFVVALFMSHQTIWVKIEPIKDKVRVKIAGRTYKNAVSFENRFKRLWEAIKEQIK